MTQQFNLNDEVKKATATLAALDAIIASLDEADNTLATRRAMVKDQLATAYTASVSRAVRQLVALIRSEFQTVEDMGAPAANELQLHSSDEGDPDL